MKIALNGSIVDTEDIYKISKIHSDLISHIAHHFHIEFFNHKLMEFDKYSKCYLGNNGYCKINDIQITNGTINNIIDSKEYQESLLDITNFRNSIYKIWSDNQSKLPRFNLDYNPS